eukprot:Awhi_evm1s13438
MARKTSKRVAKNRCKNQQTKGSDNSSLHHNLDALSNLSYKQKNIENENVTIDILDKDSNSIHISSDGDSASNKKCKENDIHDMSGKNNFDVCII